MKRKIFLFLLAYFPIALVAMQLLVNVLALVNKEYYLSIGFYLNTFFGTNVLFSLFLIGLTFGLKFCAISRAAAIAEMCFALCYLIIKEDNVYNITIQITIGAIALLYTIYKYTKLFPNCKYSTAILLLTLMIKKGNCISAMQEFENLTIKNHIHNGN